jgi:hypothetical protein
LERILGKAPASEEEAEISGRIQVAKPDLGWMDAPPKAAKPVPKSPSKSSGPGATD